MLMWREAPLVTWYVTVGSDGLNEPFRRDLVVMKTYCRTLQYAASTISPLIDNGEILEVQQQAEIQWTA